MYVHICLYTHIYISTNKNVKLSKTSSMVRKYIAILMWLWCCRIIQGTCGILVNLYFGILSNPQTLSSFLSPLSLEVKCKALFRGQRRIRTRWSMTHILFVWHIWRFMFQSIPFATTFATTLHWGFHLEILELANQPIHLGPWRTRFCGTSCTGNVLAGAVDESDESSSSRSEVVPASGASLVDSSSSSSTSWAWQSRDLGRYPKISML